MFSNISQRGYHGVLPYALTTCIAAAATGLSAFILFAISPQVVSAAPPNVTDTINPPESATPTNQDDLNTSKESSPVNAQQKNSGPLSSTSHHSTAHRTTVPSESVDHQNTSSSTLSSSANGWSNFGNIETERWYANGTMVTSQEFTDPATGQRYYANTDGSIAHDVDMQLPSNGTTITVRFAHDGHLVTGMDCKDGAWYFFNLEDGSMAYGERYINYDKEHTGWYYFDPYTGKMAHGMTHLQSNGGKWVYYDATTGIMAHGERYINYDKEHTGWYYFDPYTGKMAHGNVYIPHWGKWCWTGADGKLQGDTPGKIGWQNPAAFYQVSSKNVNKVGQGMFSYIQPSRLSVDGSRADAINIFVNTALSYLGSPYKWNYALWPGGGSDCAGLVISSMESVGMQTPYNAYDHRFQAWQDHDANNMWNDPRIMKVAVADRRRGDLVFYPGHVAIYLGNNKIINAYPPHVEYDSIWRWPVRGIGRLFI
ncbi:C40 family peptidase [Bifidobacterium boum]|uniref:C40 family peptidase n=1 Tax=Bifidobacterium boum TaxID=78343 RepID=UPI0024326EDB|nr:NlpC/P60 family protein [Bifidobacterium boum]MCI5862242.1 NlpC/P60 family protein [Bifidobacterium boum]